MPHPHSPLRRFLADSETLLHVLHLYGAGGIAAFGWALGALIGLPTAPWVPLWFCAALLIYNVDRLRRDPADARNVPRRAAASTRWRGVLRAAVALAALGLLGLPVWRRDWLTLALVLSGGVVSLGYSVPVLGVRWKDVPLVKTLFAPAVVTLAIFGLLARGEISTIPGVATFPQASEIARLSGAFLALGSWAFCYLLFNMLLCDLRDLAGDRACGIRSLPVLWGETGTRRLLWGLAVLGQMLLFSELRHLRGAMLIAVLALLTGLYQAWLLQATRRPRSERFYEWAVEGLLYLPALAFAATHLLSRLIPD